MFQPFNAQEGHMVLSDQNFNFLLRKDHQKMSYERRVYESVDDLGLKRIKNVRKDNYSSALKSSSCDHF